MGENAKNGTQLIPMCTPTLGIALVQESRMFKVLVEKANRHQIGPPRYHWKGFEI